MKKYILLFLMVIALTSGGCGGGSSGDLQGDSPAEDSPPQVSARLDSNGDGVPDVFGYYDASYSDGRNAPNDGRAYDVPYLNYIDSSDVEEDGSFTANIYLEQAHEYVMKYSHSSRPLGEHDIDFTILAPDEKNLAFDFGFKVPADDDAPSETQQEDSSAAVSGDAGTIQPESEQLSDPSTDITHEYISVKASIDIVPPENPCMIFYTFTAPQTGVYSFTVREKKYSPTSHDVPYELRIYSSDDNSALKLGSITMTPRELLDVQRVLMSYADKFNSDGLPVSFRPELMSEDVYQNTLQSLSEKNVAASRLRAAADSDTAIKPVVYGVPYDVEFAPGVGFYADSGLRALESTAFENFVLPTPQTGSALPVATSFKVKEIVTEEEHTREQELEDMTTFALGKNALGARPLTAMNVRLAQCSKTIVVRYDVIERQPRMVDVNTLKFSPEALEILKEYTHKEFREEFGDYFVAGYTWGMRFQAVISVTSNNSSTLDKACTIINSIMSLARGNDDYSSKTAEFEALSRSSYLNIDVDEVLIEGGDPRKNSFSTNSLIGSVADALASFSEQVQKAKKENYSPMKVCLERFREVPAAKSFIPERLPVSQSHFNAILNMNRTIFRTRFYLNALTSIPVSNLADGNSKLNGWRDEFANLVSLTLNQINYICESESRTNDYQRRFQSLCDKYRALCERYVFYRRLVDAQNSQSRGFSDTDSDRDGSISGGIKTYSQSSIVMGDYGSYAGSMHYDKRFAKGAEFLKYWYWNITGDQSGNNWRYVWFETGWHDTNSSKGEDQSYPTVGSKKLKWYFEGGTWRRVEWYFKDKIIRMRPDDYPFVGLKD